MDEKEAYEQGSRMAWTVIMRTCLKYLGCDDPEGQKATWVIERAETVAMLRRVCERYGDNDWSEGLHLADVIEKHLWNSLEE